MSTGIFPAIPSSGNGGGGTIGGSILLNEIAVGSATNAINGSSNLLWNGDYLYIGCTTGSNPLNGDGSGSTILMDNQNSGNPLQLAFMTDGQIAGNIRANPNGNGLDISSWNNSNISFYTDGDGQNQYFSVNNDASLFGNINMLNVDVYNNYGSGCLGVGQYQAYRALDIYDYYGSGFDIGNSQTNLWDVDNGGNANFQSCSASSGSFGTAVINQNSNNSYPWFSVYDNNSNLAFFVGGGSSLNHDFVMTYWNILDDGNGKLNLPRLPSGTLVSPPSGLNIGDIWEDTTTSAQYPIIRIRKT